MNPVAPNGSRNRALTVVSQKLLYPFGSLNEPDAIAR